MARGKKSLFSDPGPELHLGTEKQKEERKNAKTIDGMSKRNKKKKSSQDAWRQKANGGGGGGSR